MNNLEFMGEFIAPIQRTREEFEKTGSSPFAPKLFFIEKKNGSKIGLMNYFTSVLLTELLVPATSIANRRILSDSLSVCKYHLDL